MTIEKIEENLPNGFHDSFLNNIAIDYLTKEVVIKLDVWVGDIQSKNLNEREKYRNMMLKLKNLFFFIIEKPDHTYSFFNDQKMRIDFGVIKSSQEFDNLKNLIESIPKEAFSCWIFVVKWNSFIYFSALDAEYKWI